MTDGTRSAAQTYTLTVVPRLTIAPPRCRTTVRAAARCERREGRVHLVGRYRLRTPSGLALDSGTGLLSGRPTIAGTFSLELIITDALGFTGSVDLELALAAKISITTKALSPAKAGHAFRTRLGVSGGVLPRTWKLVQGSLPAGIRLNKHTGELSGIARRAGRATVVVQVTDALGGVSTARLRLRVRP